MAEDEFYQDVRSKLEAFTNKKIVNPIIVDKKNAQQAKEEQFTNSDPLSQAFSIAQDIDTFEATKFKNMKKALKFSKVNLDKFNPNNKVTLPSYYQKFIEPVYEENQKTNEKNWCMKETLYEIT